MGGMERIYYTATSRYAEEHSIPIEPFLTLINAMDDEYMAWVAEKAKADADRTRIPE